jgi:ribose transport system permease protein
MTTTTSTQAPPESSGGFKIGRFISRHFRVLLAYAVLIILVVITASLNDRFFNVGVLTSTFNKGMTLVFAGMAQTSVVITGGIDLSVGSILSLSNSLASVLFGESHVSVLGASAFILLVGATCGLVNGLIVVYGRLQPIIVTIATASIYGGIALYLRPTPGGSIPLWYNDLLTRRVVLSNLGLPESWDVIPSALVLLGVVMLVVWLPFRRSRLGMWVYAVGSNEGAAYMSGVNVNRAKLSAYALGGLFAAIAGLFLSAQTLSGDATTGAVFTLQSIAVVVLGGTSLFGGQGGVLGTIAGAYALRMIGDVLFFARVNPLQQPLWEGVVILLAVALGASRIFTVKNRLDMMR